MHVLPRPMWSWLLALALAVCAQALAQTPFKPVPPLHGHVTDEVGMLTPDERQRLEAVLTDYETKTGSQIAVSPMRTGKRPSGTAMFACGSMTVPMRVSPGRRSMETRVPGVSGVMGGCSW